MSTTIRSNGREWPAKRASRWRSTLWGRWRDWSVRNVEVRGQGTVYRFVCGGLRDYARVAGLFVEEPGTAAWIHQSVKPGDVFYDIGANVGIFTIMAAHHVGPSGRVVAFEPHAANFAALMRNVAANGFGDRVIAFNAAVHQDSGFYDFNYASLGVGSAASQLIGNAVPGKSPFETVAREMKYAVAIDRLVAGGLVPRPTHVKIDVDGNEPDIVAGMAALLSRAGKPRSLSVEVSSGEEAALERWLAPYGYHLAGTNFTRTGAKRKYRGLWTAEDRYNAIFEAPALQASAAA